MTSPRRRYISACAQWLQKGEREKPHCGGTNQHALTQIPCSQQAIAFLTHAQPHCATSTAPNSLSAPYTCPVMTSALALQRQLDMAFLTCKLKVRIQILVVFIPSLAMTGPCRLLRQTRVCVQLTLDYEHRLSRVLGSTSCELGRCANMHVQSSDIDTDTVHI